MKEALKLALEALKECRDRFFPLDQHEAARDVSWGSVHSAVTKCEEALAQQEQPKVRTGDCLLVGVCASEGHKIQAQQEPWCMKMNGCTSKCEDCPVEVVQQEPVAWRNAAIRVGEDLCSVGPFGYYNMTAEQWLDWALSVVTVHAPPPQRTEERNFCSRCGKRTADLTVIHTCTPPQENT